MSNTDDENVNEMLLNFSVMDAQLRLHFLRQMCTLLTAEERELLQQTHQQYILQQQEVQKQQQEAEEVEQELQQQLQQQQQQVPQVQLIQPLQESLPNEDVSVTHVTAPKQRLMTQIKQEGAMTELDFNNGDSRSPNPVKSSAKKKRPPPKKTPSVTGITGNITGEETGTAVCTVCTGEDKSMHQTPAGNNVCRACEAFFSKHHSLEDTLVCRKDLSCRIIKKRKQAYCNYCRLHKCYQAGMSVAGHTPSAEFMNGSASPAGRPPAKRQRTTGGNSKKSRNVDDSSDDNTSTIDDHYQQAAATIQALIPQMAENDLGLEELHTSSADIKHGELDPTDDPLATVGLSQVQFDCTSQIQIPKNLVIGGSPSAQDELNINFVQGPLRDSDIAISFDE